MASEPTRLGRGRPRTRQPTRDPRDSCGIYWPVFSRHHLSADKSPPGQRKTGSNRCAVPLSPAAAAGLDMALHVPESARRASPMRPAAHT